MAKPPLATPCLWRIDLLFCGLLSLRNCCHSFQGQTSQGLTRSTKQNSRYSAYVRQVSRSQVCLEASSSSHASRRASSLAIFLKRRIAGHHISRMRGGKACGKTNLYLQSSHQPHRSILRNGRIDSPLPLIGLFFLWVADRLRPSEEGWVLFTHLTLSQVERDVYSPTNRSR
jgi:hypothetical protein